MIEGILRCILGRVRIKFRNKNMSKQDHSLGAALLTLVFFLGGCGTTDVQSLPDDLLQSLAAPDSYVATQDGVATNNAQPDSSQVKGKNGAAAKGGPFARLRRALERGDFDPSKIKAPEYNVPVYKSGIKKKQQLGALMDSAYDAYEKVTGDKWYPRRARIGTGRPSGDPLLNPNWWQIYAGQTLQRTLATWGARAGWRVVWKSDYEYPIEANAVFIGDFPKVVQRVLEVFEKEPSPVHAVFYKNRVVVIDNHEGNG